MTTTQISKFVQIKPHPHEQIFCDNFSVTNIFARVHGATNNTLKTNFHMRQK